MDPSSIHLQGADSATWKQKWESAFMFKLCCHVETADVHNLKRSWSLPKSYFLAKESENGEFRRQVSGV